MTLFMPDKFLKLGTNGRVEPVDGQQSSHFDEVVNTLLTDLVDLICHHFHDDRLNFVFEHSWVKYLSE